MTTVRPTAPDAGMKLLMLGGGGTWKVPLELAVPAAVTTVIGPLLAPLGTVAVRVVVEPTEKVVKRQLPFPSTTTKIP